MARMSAGVDGERSPLGDLVALGLRLLIVAINPSTRSAGIGYSFSSPSNPFWRLLHQSGLTPVQLQPCEEHRLLDHGIGLVSTVRRATPAAAELTLAERRAGAARVRSLIERHEPRVVALLGPTLYPVFFPSGTRARPGPHIRTPPRCRGVCAAQSKRPQQGLPRLRAQARLVPGPRRPPRIRWRHRQTMTRARATRISSRPESASGDGPSPLLENARVAVCVGIARSVPECEEEI